MENYDDYYLGFIEGVMGKGKTIRLVGEVIENYKRYNRIYANFHINLPDNQDKFVYVPKISGPIINGFEENSLFAIHEAYTIFDCRYCSTKAREKILGAVFQMRKDGIEIIADIIKLLYLDFRIIDIATDFSKALGRLYQNYYERENHFYYQKMTPFHVGRNEYDFYPTHRISLDMSDYFQYYNTREKTGKSQKLLFS